MDYNNLWKMTIPSVTSQTISLNDAMTSSTRTLSTISERESKPDFCLSFDGDEKKKDIYGHTERSKTTSLSSTCQKLNHNYSQRSFKSDLISALRGNEKESHEQIKYKISEEHVHSQICGDMSNASDVPFVELGAVYKILDLITDSDPKVFKLTRALTNNCCKEISQTLQCLLAQHHDKKLEDLLLNDSSLHRCEHCGVISYMIGSRPAIRENIKRNSTKTRRDGDIVTAERDCINDYQNNGQSDILINSTDLINNVQTRINLSKANTQTEYKDKMSKMKFVRNRSIEIENPNEANNISITKPDISATIKNKFYSDKTIKKLFTDLKTEKENKSYECNNAARNNHRKHDPLNAMNAYASGIDREEVMREILYEPKSQIDDLLVKRRSNIPQKIPSSQQLLDKHGGIYPIVDTMKYLAGGQLTELYEKEDKLLSKLQERRYTRPDDTRTERSSVLYNSREDYSQRDAGFWLFDESGHLPEIVLDKYRCPPEVDNNRKNVNFPANILRYSHTTKTMKTDRLSDYMERDSLEECTLLDQKGKSNATIFSSSSTENLTHGFLDRKCEINNVEEDISRGRKLVSSRPSLDIARHVRAQIAKDRYSRNVKESTSKLCTHGSDVLVQLPPETRRKICHLIRTIVTGKDSTFCCKEYSTCDALNNKRLLYSKSADAAFGHSNKCCKTDNEIINICADDCIATKLSELSEDKNCSQDNSVNIRSPDLNKSKDSVRIFHENMTSVSPVKSADNSTDKIIRQIIYKDASLKNIVRNNDGQIVAQILSIYQKILENSRDMDWKNFREFVEVLHPGEKELWRDVCRTISEETKRISSDADGNTEICIEIGPVNPEETLKTGNAMTCAREIVFELDMTLKDVENFLSKGPIEERLDTHEDAKDVTG